MCYINKVSIDWCVIFTVDLIWLQLEEKKRKKTLCRNCEHVQPLMHPSPECYLATAQPDFFNTGRRTSCPASTRQGELHKYISVQSLQTDEITAIVAVSTAPPFVSLQSMCTCKTFGDFEFGCFTSVKFSAQTFVYLEEYKRCHGNIQLVKEQCKNKTHRKGSVSDYI